MGEAAAHRGRVSITMCGSEAARRRGIPSPPALDPASWVISFVQGSTIHETPSGGLGRIYRERPRVRHQAPWGLPGRLDARMAETAARSVEGSVGPAAINAKRSGSRGAGGEGVGPVSPPTAPESVALSERIPRFHEGFCDHSNPSGSLSGCASKLRRPRFRSFEDAASGS